MKLYGTEVMPSPLAVTRTVGRVRGGYMNRWLIRGIVETPAIFHDRLNNVLYVHPDLMAKLIQEFKVDAIFRREPWFS